MNDNPLEDLAILLPPLLQSVETLGFIARYLDPMAVGQILAACGSPDAALRLEVGRLQAWPDSMADVAQALAGATEETLAGFDALRAAAEGQEGMGEVFRALRHLPRALAALYPLAQNLPPVSRLFLDPPRRGDTARLRQLAEAAPRDTTGVHHIDNAPGQRGGFSLYVPEDYDPERVYPLVMALHGGSGHGAGFLWSWLREARTYGAILAAPTSMDRTWAISGPDPDTPNLARILDLIRSRWTLDPQRLLLAGMSDGGTFAYVSGLEPASPFTHLAPTASAFHPMMVGFADPDRLRGLPIHITHGKLDWMFDVTMARAASKALAGAGAAVTYRELDDLAHTYPRELNVEILAWLDGGPVVPYR